MVITFHSDIFVVWIWRSHFLIRPGAVFNTIFRESYFLWKDLDCLGEQKFVPRYRVHDLDTFRLWSGCYSQNNVCWQYQAISVEEFQLRFELFHAELLNLDVLTNSFKYVMIIFICTDTWKVFYLPDVQWISFNNTTQTVITFLTYIL